MFPKIYTKSFTFPGAIQSDDMSNNAMPNDTLPNDDKSSDTTSSDTTPNVTISASEQECLNTLLMKLVNNKYVSKIESIKITYKVNY